MLCQCTYLFLYKKWLVKCFPNKMLFFKISYKTQSTGPTMEWGLSNGDVMKILLNDVDFSIAMTLQFVHEECLCTAWYLMQDPTHSWSYCYFWNACGIISLTWQVGSFKLKDWRSHNASSRHRTAMRNNIHLLLCAGWNMHSYWCKPADQCPGSKPG